MLHEILPNTGVDGETNWLMVPLNGFTWFGLPSGLRVRPTSKRVSVHRAGRASRLERAARAAAKQIPIGKWFPHPADRLIADAMKRQGLDVYFVRGRTAGDTRLTIRDSRGRAAFRGKVISVSVHKPQTVTVALNRVMHKLGNGGSYPIHGST